MSIRRIYVEKKEGFDVEARLLRDDFIHNLGIKDIQSIRFIQRYDIEGMNDKWYSLAKDTIFSEPPTDNLFEEEIDMSGGHFFAVEYLPGQYDQRADSAEQCVGLLTGGVDVKVKTSRIIGINGNITEEEFKKIKEYYINPVESRIACFDKPQTLEDNWEEPANVTVIDGFISLDYEALKGFLTEYGMAMDADDIAFCQNYFKNIEKRNPTVTEIRMIDTYWSDHCRHTTFLTRLDNVEIKNDFIRSIYNEYLASRKFVYGDRDKPVCLMDVATVAMKELKKKGALKNLDESEEVNACSIEIPVDVDGKTEQWLVMFKNETHNHPTEIEPFGGAATCLGGAIRDPLSGRAYVYQAMRVTGSGDPRVKLADTLSGKLPQRKITTGAAAGYSSYGNQIGLATGQVTEIYDEGYIAKRMEIGAVIAAAPKENVIREAPQAGDVIILVGGRTGRDGCGGATGSSKAHTDESLTSCGAEVQKGNPPEERKIQRLFRKKEVAAMIKRCNDFGAGGVSVAIGELADGLIIDLDKIPKKYEGLDGTELAISESQERMAVVVRVSDVGAFIAETDKENLLATVVAEVTNSPRLVMKWRGNIIADISREFLNTNGAPKSVEVLVEDVLSAVNVNFSKHQKETGKSIKEKIMDMMDDLNIASQKGLVERFDSTVGAGSVFLPFGGKHQLTPQQSMVAKIPVLNGETDTATVMAYGYNPKISAQSPFKGAVYAVVESVTKAVCAGARYKDIYLTFQEYFERLGNDKHRWGKPLAALLGAYYAQKQLGIAAIGGKDSMSGTFNDIDVPPTLVSFAVAPVSAKKAVSSEFKSAGSTVVLLKPKPLKNGMGLPGVKGLKEIYKAVHGMISNGMGLRSAHAIAHGGIAEAVCKMSFGNKIGFEFDEKFDINELFDVSYGSILLEFAQKPPIISWNYEAKLVGKTIEQPVIKVNNEEVAVDDIIERWQKPLEGVFPTVIENKEENVPVISYGERVTIKPKSTFAKPRVFIPAFPGTNCEYDSARAFERAGGVCSIGVFKNIKSGYISASVDEFVDEINNAQILMIPGGFSGGDEPDGSGKFIATVFRNPKIKEATEKMLNERDGLILGICNGFQALIKLGLVPYGEIRNMDSDCPTLTFNTIGRHISHMVNTRIASVKSPWLNGVGLGDIHSIAVSHGEGRFIASDKLLAELERNGQIATQYVDLNGNPTYTMPYNPNGSIYSVEGITSPDGRVFGKMGHSERMGENVAKNFPGNKDQRIFESGVGYFK